MISTELLKEVLLEQRRKVEEAKTRGYALRENLAEIKKFVGIRHNIVITGVRRCGKSVFLTQIISNFFGEYYYINFEDERLSGFEVKDFSKLYELCIELFGSSKVFFLDEVQNVDGWERWVRRMYDDRFKFFITGSNARMLSKELATVLTGRHLQFSIYPFSFREFLQFCKFSLQKNDIYAAERRALIRRHFSDYLNQGGFPEFLETQRIEILQGYFSDIIERDIVERYKVGNVKQLKQLALYLITNSGNLTTYNQLKRLGGIKSATTIIKYFSYLENSYILFSVPFFSYSLKKQVSNPFKVFAIDAGLRSAVAFNASRNIGNVYETVVSIELKRRKEEIYYWKDYQHHEVDFVLKQGMKIKELLQVCYDVTSIKTKEREVRALLKASKELKCRKLTVITESYEAEEKAEWYGTRREVKFTPLWKWLLEWK